jgi:hypothetical protein
MGSVHPISQTRHNAEQVFWYFARRRSKIEESNSRSNGYWRPLSRVARHDRLLDSRTTNMPVNSFLLAFSKRAARSMTANQSRHSARANWKAIPN